jgi:hypothetical protein
MGNRWGKAKGDGEEGGGEVSIQSTRDQSGQESHHDAKEGFQVSKKGIQGQGQGFPSKGVAKRIGLCTLNHANLVHIVLTVCMSC